MARKRTKAAKQAHVLLVWLEGLGLPTRVINALRRDLEVITGEREGEKGAGVLAGFDQARFTEELYQPRGGQIGKVPTVAKGAIDALRAAIPAPVSGDSIEAAQEAQGAEAAPESAAATQPTESDDVSANASQEGDEPAPESVEAVMQEAMPEVAGAAPTDAADKQPTDAALAAPPEPANTPATPKRRGRPPRAAAAAAATAEPAVAPETPTKRRGRAPRDEAAAGLPQRTRRARVAAVSAAQQAAPPVNTPAPAPAALAAPPVADPSFAVLLRLWRELHPRASGRRCTMASLTGEE
jgi:hypothetical protein